MSTRQEKTSGFGFRNYRGPLHDEKKGQLIFTNGAAMVRVFADINGTDLFSSYFEGLIPEMKTNEGIVTVEYGYNYQFPQVHSPRGKILLNGFIPWDIIIKGWVYEVAFNLKELNLNRFDIQASVKDMELILPSPERNVSVQVSGGASSLTITRPAETEIQLKVTGGAKNLSIDDQNFKTIDVPFERETSGFKDTLKRYDIHINGGASNLNLGTY